VSAPLRKCLRLTSDLEPFWRVDMVIMGRAEAERR
jgi:hypothetical protein